jgi:hypothetical protein
MSRTVPAAVVPARVVERRAAPGRPAPAARPGPATGRSEPATSLEAAAREEAASARRGSATNPAAAARGEAASARPGSATNPAAARSLVGLEPQPAVREVRPEMWRILAGRSAPPAGRAPHLRGQPPSPRFWGRHPRLTCLRSPPILHTRRRAGARRGRRGKRRRLVSAADGQTSSRASVVSCGPCAVWYTHASPGGAAGHSRHGRRQTRRAGRGSLTPSRRPAILTCFL